MKEVKTLIRSSPSAFELECNRLIAEEGYNIDSTNIANTKLGQVWSAILTKENN